MSSHTRPLPAAAHGRALAIAIAVVVIVSGFAAARADAFVYWAVSPMNTIGRANLDGTGISQSFFGAGSPQGVAVDGAHIYWADISNNSVGRANLDGTSADPDFITGADKPQAVAVDAAGVAKGVRSEAAAGDFPVGFEDLIAKRFE
jgi:sugar lactone lactonase YvrE